MENKLLDQISVDRLIAPRRHFGVRHWSSLPVSIIGSSRQRNNGNIFVVSELSANFRCCGRVCIETCALFLSKVIIARIVRSFLKQRLRWLDYAGNFNAKGKAAWPKTQNLLIVRHAHHVTIFSLMFEGINWAPSISNINDGTSWSSHMTRDPNPLPDPDSSLKIHSRWLRQENFNKIPDKLRCLTSASAKFNFSVSEFLSPWTWFVSFHPVVHTFFSNLISEVEAPAVKEKEKKKVSLATVEALKVFSHTLMTDYNVNLGLPSSRWFGAFT